MSSFPVRLLLVSGLVAALSPTAGAQLASRQRSNDAVAASSQPSATSNSRRSSFGINPLGIPFEVVSIEFESALHDAFTLAGNFSYFSPDDYTRSSLELKGRLYPNEQAPYGFSVGLGLGAVNTRETVVVDGLEQRADKTYPAIGVYVDYNWLLGRSNRFLVGTGLGAKRILGDEDEFDEAPFVYGTARFLIGVAF